MLSFPWENVGTVCLLDHFNFESFIELSVYFPKFHLDAQQRLDGIRGKSQIFYGFINIIGNLIKILFLLFVTERILITRENGPSVRIF